MAGLLAKIRNRLAPRATQRFWSTALSTIDDMPRPRLRKLSAEARRLVKLLNRFDRRAQDRLAPTQSAPLIPGAAWAQRVDLFAEPISPQGHAPLTNNTQISEMVTAFTDDPVANVGFRQTPNTNGGHSAILDIHHLSGSYLSLAIGLGAQVAKTIGKDSLVRIRLECHSEQNIETLLRLNLRSGPNTEQVIRHFTPGQDIEFDLFYVEFEPERMNDAWIDLMFPPHGMNRIELSDMIISKHPRADI